MIEEKPRILIVEARFHDQVTAELLKGAVDAIEAFGAEYDVVTAPGPLEIPAVIAMADDGGHRAIGVSYDGYVALGAVIRGETYQYEVVANETTRGLVDLSIGRRLAIGNGVLIVEDEEQAMDRARMSQGDRGGHAARACLDMIAVRRRLLGQVK
jgi:6,7-dimethyl-8-ribityllumazine synthase